MRYRYLAGLIGILVIPSTVTLLLNALGFKEGFLTLELGLMILMCGLTYLMSITWLGDLDVKYLNGWEQWDDADRKALMRNVGFYSTFSMILLSVSIAITFTGRLWALALIIPVFLLIVIPMAFATGDHYTRKAPLLDLPDSNKFGLILVLCLLTAVPFCFSGSSSDAVEVELGDDQFHVTAPMFDHTFVYSDVEELRYEVDFDKGSRRAGFATFTIMSGRFHNDEFGNYDLASFAEVTPCITLLYKGSHYAFNLSTVELTLDMYNQLQSRI